MVVIVSSGYSWMADLVASCFALCFCCAALFVVTHDGQVSFRQRAYILASRSVQVSLSPISFLRAEW